MTKSRSGGGWLDCPKIWPSWGGPPKGTRRGLTHGGDPTDDDLLEIYKALYGYRWGEPLQCVPDHQEDRVSMPGRLFVMLCRLVDWNLEQLPWTQERKDWLRAVYVAQERAAGKTLSKAYVVAAKRLTDGEIVRGLKVEPSPAAAGAESIKKSYQKVLPSPRKTRKRKLLAPR
jgi:hypothetical protein